MLISDWSSDWCSSDLHRGVPHRHVALCDVSGALGVVAHPGEVTLGRDAERRGVRQGDGADPGHERAPLVDGVEQEVGGSEERRVGEECVSTGRSRWLRYN